MSLEFYCLRCLRRSIAFHCLGFQEEREEVLSVTDLAEVRNQVHHLVHCLFHLLFGLVSDGLHLALEGFDDLCVAYALNFVLASALIFFLEDVAREGFERPYDVPSVAAVQLLSDVVSHPVLHLVLFAHCLYEAVHGVVYDFVMRQFDLQVGRQAQFASHASEDALEEGVDGFHAEM